MAQDPYTNALQRETVLTLAGELDMEREAEIRTAVTEALVSQPVAIVLDLTNVSFIDSSGLRALLLADQDANARGVALRVRGLTARVAQVIAVTKLDEVLTIEP